MRNLYVNTKILLDFYIISVPLTYNFLLTKKYIQLCRKFSDQLKINQKIGTMETSFVNEENHYIN